MSNRKTVVADHLDSDLTKVADAIRSKTGTTEQLDFPDGFIKAISQLGNSVANLTDNVYEEGRFASAGTEHIDVPNYSFRTANYLPVEGGRTISAEISGLPSRITVDYPMQVVQYNSNKEIIVKRTDVDLLKLNGTATGKSNTTLTLNENTAYIRYDMYIYSDIGWDLSNLDEVEAVVYYVD